LFGGFNNKSLQDFYKITISADENNQIVTESLEVPSFVQNLRAASLSLLPFQSQLILFGGRTDKQLSDVTYSFALGSSKWSTSEAVGPSARYYHQTCLIDGRVIIHGGLGLKEGSDKAANLNDMWIYSDDAPTVPAENIVLDPSYIPVEIWSLALSYLEASGESISSASVVSKQFYNIIMADERLKEPLKRHVQSKRIYLPPINEDSIKIVILGAGGIGKSATTIQFIQHHFIDEYDPTIEDNYRKQVRVDDRTVVLDILDTAGPEEYSSMLQLWMETGHGVYGMYSITDERSLKELEYHLERAGRMKGGAYPAIVVGNKCDLATERKVSQERGQALAKQYNAMWIETSARDNRNIEEAMLMLTRAILAADKSRNHKATPPPKKDRCIIS
jgi:GTPase KRas protein